MGRGREECLIVVAVAADRFPFVSHTLAHPNVCVPCVSCTAASFNALLEVCVRTNDLDRGQVRPGAAAVSTRLAGSGQGGHGDADFYSANDARLSCNS